MLTRPATPTDLPRIEALLNALSLPLAGVADHLEDLRLAEDGSSLLGMAGLERHGRVALLRSVAVTPAAQGQGLAAQLVGEVLDHARALELEEVYLLTTTAATYFPRLGFTEVPRVSAPAALLASREFQDACPQTATLMHLPLKEPAMTQTIPGLQNHVTTHEFLAALRAESQRPLEFWLHGERLVPAGYHVTEVKAVSIESMDCGGKANAWRETVIQLMDGTAEEARAGFMTNRKFLAIYDRVAQRVPVSSQAEVRFEYGNSALPAMQYHVAGLEILPGSLQVHLRAPGVQCKASDACGTPATGINASCAPESGCCTPAAPDLITLG
ncbi:hypothetical protein DEIPH_ctg139orf0151 [Deinococcus phoenicis]|uniref:N-acetyltransferase domain-containing protein n=1 Tax=Deinococcus phoenicis TaxID=1476583 RepID=A0A016QKA7_9DEIO|nr:arsenic resistance N-acetyltransferase ArsN2 [Deinococcus phoenicis]EYB66421.1 hypothetical protein DEIPH_ctg139orf0151 [Deinococcus phoenicis]